MPGAQTTRTLAWRDSASIPRGRRLVLFGQDDGDEHRGAVEQPQDGIVLRQRRQTVAVAGKVVLRCAMRNAGGHVVPRS